MADPNEDILEEYNQTREAKEEAIALPYQKAFSNFSSTIFQATTGLTALTYSLSYDERVHAQSAITATKDAMDSFRDGTNEQIQRMIRFKLYSTWADTRPPQFGTGFLEVEHSRIHLSNAKLHINSILESLGRDNPIRTDLNEIIGLLNKAIEITKGELGNTPIQSQLGYNYQVVMSVSSVIGSCMKT